ncbi:MAG: hypothetical protein FJ297_10225 [Planctomycetes bacterium]|nr:hypothetical protein [Planctomycetota bacterium]
MRKSIGRVVLLGFAAVVVGNAIADEPKIVPILEGLAAPMSLAVQPETGTVFLSESGAGKVIRVGADGKAADVITGFPVAPDAEGPDAFGFPVGPLGLAFTGKNVLIVGEGGRPAGEDQLRVFDLPADGSAIAADAMRGGFTLGPIDNAAGEGDFACLAANPTAVFAVGRKDLAKGWIGKCELKEDGSFGPFARFLATKDALPAAGPAGLTIDGHGNLVVGQAGERGDMTDSLLAFFHAKSGKLEASFTTELRDIVGLAYFPPVADNPRRGKLLAVDFASADPARGGLYEIVAKADDKSGSAAKKIIGLTRPTALVFDPAGTLYVTELGAAAEGSPPAGRLLRIEW